MTDAHDRTPTTFWEDRLHFASGQISEWLRPTLKDLFTNSLQLTLTAFFALLFFGAASFSGHAEAYLAAAGGTIIVFLFKRLAGMVLFVYYYIKAPPSMWRRDQKRIADLEARFIPSLRLEFSEGIAERGCVSAKCTHRPGARDGCASREHPNTFS